MHELTRMAYLEAMGIDSYVSRRQLPGAAPTRRLVPVRPTPQVAVAPAQAQAEPLARPPEVAIPQLEPVHRKPAPRPSEATPAPAREPVAPAAERFSLAAITAGGYIWVEELVQPVLAREQVQLIRAMARAVSGKDAAPGVQQFDWPLHQNRQFDLGEEAARAAVAGFLKRQLEQQACTGLVLLGEACSQRVALDWLGDVAIARTLDTLQLLAQPQLKKQAWRDLSPLVHDH